MIASMIDVTLDAAGLTARLSALDAALRQPAPLLRQVGEALVESTRLRFRGGFSPAGEPWQGLAPSTLSKRRKGSDKPLLDTGRLRNSIQLRGVGADAVEVFSPVIYAARQQFGARKGEDGVVTARVPAHRRRGPSGRRYSVREHSRHQVSPWGAIPARPFLGVSAEDEREIVRLVRAYVAQALG